MGKMWRLLALRPGMVPQSVGTAKRGEEEKVSFRSIPSGNTNSNHSKRAGNIDVTVRDACMRFGCVSGRCRQKSAVHVVFGATILLFQCIPRLLLFAVMFRFGTCSVVVKWGACRIVLHFFLSVLFPVYSPRNRFPVGFCAKVYWPLQLNALLR